MFSQPKALVAETLHVLSQIDRAGNGTASRLAFAHADQIENGNRQPTGHVLLDNQSGRAIRKGGESLVFPAPAMQVGRTAAWLDSSRVTSAGRIASSLQGRLI